jgi:hypothetical protein
VVFSAVIETTENRIDDSIHAGDVDEHNPGPRPAAHFDKASLDGVGGAQFAPQVLLELEKRQQCGQILLQALDQFGILGLPAKPESLERFSGGGLAVGLIDALSVLLDRVVVGRAHCLAEVSRNVKARFAKI